MLTDFPSPRFNKYSQICARAVRQSLKESERVKAEKFGVTTLRYQNWEDGKGGEQVRVSSLLLHLAKTGMLTWRSYLAGLSEPA